MQTATRCVICCAALVAFATGAEARWYVGGGAGVVLHSGMDQVGWNADTVCYPTDACFAMDPVPSVPGYRWRYAIEADAGAVLGIALGREFSGFRMEVSVAQGRNDLEQEFVDIEHLDGSRGTPREGSVIADVTTSIGALTTRIASLDVYRDLAPSGARLSPYIGVGLGAAFATIRNVQFSADYRDTSPVPPTYDPPLSFYGSASNIDHADTVLAYRVHVGADYPTGENMRVGAKLTCSHIEATADDGSYSRHPMHARDPGFGSRNTFDASRNCSIALTLKRRLGR